MKTILTLVVSMVFSVATYAQDYNLYIQTSSSETGYALSDLRKLTFVDGKINVTKKDGTIAKTFALTDINKMYFSTTPLAIGDVKDDDKADSDKDLIYNLQGVRVTSSYKGIVIKNGKKTIQN